MDVYRFGKFWGERVQFSKRILGLQVPGTGFGMFMACGVTRPLQGLASEPSNRKAVRV